MKSMQQDKCWACVDIGGTATKIGALSKDGLDHDSLKRLPTPRDVSGAQFALWIAGEVEELRKAGRRLVGVGISVPGLLSDDRELVELCPNTPFLKGYPWRAEIESRLGLPVALEVDCNAAALGEYWLGAGVGSRRLLVIALGTGAGVSFLINGTPLRFSGACCGDLGHVYVGGKRRCSAGCKGCLESEVSVERLGGSDETTRELLSEARRGKKIAIERLQVAGHFLGRAIATFNSCFLPDLVLIAGGLSEGGSALLDSASAACQEYGGACFQAPIRKAAFGARAALVGAAIGMAMQPDS